MNTNEIRVLIKQAISRVTGIAVEGIADDARFVEDLGLDSLSVIESLVLVEHELRITAQQEDGEAEVRSIEDAVQLVRLELTRKAG
jgi:acyl carrier protein